MFKASKLIQLFLVLQLGAACALNNSETNTPLGPIKGGQMSDDPDYFINLWPEGTGPEQEKNPLAEVELKNWPEIKEGSHLFIGDESLHYNWGLVLKSSFVSKGKESLFLSGCQTTALTWKNGDSSDCGLITNPYIKFTEKPIHLTVDTQKGSERALPVILSQANVQKIVLSFGHYLKDISNEQALREELAAIEILAKWSHSTGKVCHFVSPVGPYFFETGNSDFLPEDLIQKLKDLISPYCYWADAHELRENFLQATGIQPQSAVIEQPAQDQESSDDLIRLNEESQGIQDLIDTLRQWNENPDSANDTGLNSNNENANSNESEETSVPVQEEPQTEENQQTEPPQSGESLEIINSNGERETIEIKEGEEPVSSTISVRKDDDPAQVLGQIPDDRIPRPEPKPHYVSTQEQEKLRQEIESRSNQQAQNIQRANTQAMQYQQPRYLWNGYARGGEYTQIGHEELERWGKHLFQTQQLSDAQAYCPNYWNLSQVDRKNVWLFLYSAMALYESSFNPSAGGKEVTGGTSLGLFQLHYEGCKDSASSAQDLKNPRINFRCAVRKSSYFVRKGSQIASGYYKDSCKRQGCKYYGGALDRYWSTLRNPYMARVIHNGKTVSVKVGKRPQVIGHLRSLPHCQK